MNQYIALSVANITTIWKIHHIQQVSLWNRKFFQNPMKLKVRKESEAGQKEARIKFLDTPIMFLIMSPKTFIISKDEIKAEYDKGCDIMQQTAKEEVNGIFQFQRYTL